MNTSLPRARHAPARPRRPRPFIGLALALVAAGPAQAGRPLQTEDAGVLQAGECEWQSIASRTRNPIDPPARDWSTEVACGTPWQTQFALAYGQSRLGAERASSLGLSAKRVIIAGGDDALSLALVPGVAATAPAHTRRYHLDTASLNLVASWPIGARWTVHANLTGRIDRPRGGSSVNVVGWALASQWSASDAFSIGAEAFADERSRPTYGAGVLWNVTRSWSVTAAWHASREVPGERLVSASAKLAF